MRWQADLVYSTWGNSQVPLFTAPSGGLLTAAHQGGGQNPCRIYGGVNQASPYLQYLEDGPALPLVVPAMEPPGEKGRHSSVCSTGKAQDT